MLNEVSRAFEEETIKRAVLLAISFTSS